MREFKSTEEILDFAIGEEQSAADFYTNLAEQVSSPSIRKMFLEFSEEELKYYYAKADSYENEYWHYLLSPQLWTSFTEATGMTTQELPLAIARLTQLSYQELSDAMKACIDSPEAGKEKLKEFKIL